MREGECQVLRDIVILGLLACDISCEDSILIDVHMEARERFQEVRNFLKGWQSSHGGERFNTSMTSFKSVGYQEEGGVCRDVRDSLVRADGTAAEASI